MKLAVIAVGRLKAGPERLLVERYEKRMVALGRTLGFTVAMAQVPESRARLEAGRKSEEALALIGRIGEGPLVAFDEGGQAMSSGVFARRLAGWRDAGAAALSLVIGGPDGLGEAVLSRAALKLSFGAMTLPHQFVRVLVAEQTYRAMTILSGHPYHRP